MGKLKKVNAEKQLLKDVALLIEDSKQYVAQTVNTTLTLLYWKIGKRINDEFYRTNAQNMVNRLSHHCHDNWLKNMAKVGR